MSLCQIGKSQQNCKIHLVEKIFLTSEYDKDFIIGQITSLSVLNSGKIVIADEYTNSVCLFSESGKKITMISKVEIDAIDPGKGKLFSPTKVITSPRDEIFIQSLANPIGYLYKMNSDLKFIGKVNYNESNTSYSFGFDSSGDLISYIVNSPMEIFIQIQNFNKKRRFDSFPVPYKNIVNRRSVTNGITKSINGNIYIVSSCSQNVFVYDSTGKLRKTLSHLPLLYKPPKKDIPDELDPSEFLKSLKEFGTWTLGVYFIEPDKILRSFKGENNLFF